MTYANVASVHKEKAHALIDDLGVDVIITQPPTRTAATTSIEKVLGTTTFEETPGVVTTVTGHVHNGRVPTNAIGLMEDVRVVGLVQKSDLVVSFKLEDVLSDATKKHGRTIVDTARSIEIEGTLFEVMGTFKSGFAPLGPYILWAGLAVSGE